MALPGVIRQQPDETPDEYWERAHDILIGMAPYNPVAAIYHLDVLGYAPDASRRKVKANGKATR